MKYCIHRGAEEIGGNCVEIESNGSHLILDVGLPLNTSNPTADLLPPITGLIDGQASGIAGIVVSHPHMDHWGLLNFIHPSVPFYMGEDAYRILREAQFFGTMQIGRPPAATLKDRQAIEIGPFRVTPFLMDHSAYDAYALLVEVDGCRLFYSGDLRAHGRKAPLFKRFVTNPPRDIDVLFLEGTQIRPHPAQEPQYQTEAELEAVLLKTLNTAKGIALAAFSAQNIDRLVTIYRATKKAGRTLVLDLYADTISRATGNPNIPQAGFDSLKVFVTHAQKLRVKRSGEFERVERIKPWRVFPEGIDDHANHLVMLFRASMISDFEKMNCLKDGIMIWSLWPGYLDDEDGKKVSDFADRHQLPLIHHHTSGHAFVKDLKLMVDALCPRVVIPIHSGASHRFGELFPNVEQVPNGLWREVKDDSR